MNCNHRKPAKINTMRIMILGRPRGCKSTIAWELGKTHNIPVYHLDKYFYTDHWEE